MKNHWVTFDDDIATWTADLTPRRDDAEALWAWLEIVVGSAEQNEVHIVREAPSLEYVRESGPLLSHLGRLFADEGKIDLFHFEFAVPEHQREGRALRAAARMAYFDAGGQLTEEYVDDLGELLRSLRPADYEEAVNFMYRCSPLKAWGPLVDSRNSEKSNWWVVPGEATVDFSIRSDIWYPYISGLLEPDVTVDYGIDNRALSGRHTPRLNAFLADVRQATVAIGGTWKLDGEQRTTYEGLLSDAGIDLDATPP
jgi:hypothetical protein